jgi:hypothetical protein
VKPPVVNPQEKLDNIPLYIIPPRASGHRAVCRATEALAEGMVDTGNGQFELYPTATAVAGSTTILFNTVPPAAANSVRNGPLKIKVTIVP